jgi:hypothetical protein
VTWPLRTEAAPQARHCLAFVRSPAHRAWVGPCTVDLDALVNALRSQEAALAMGTRSVAAPAGTLAATALVHSPTTYCRRAHVG